MYREEILYSYFLYLEQSDSGWMILEGLPIVYTYDPLYQGIVMDDLISNLVNALHMKQDFDFSEYHKLLWVAFYGGFTGSFIPDPDSATRLKSRQRLYKHTFDNKTKGI